MESNLPLPIRRLSETLVNRIAAGEIIHRPASALKELVENCLDAGATQIKVTVKDGGLKLMQIQDNGCGIRKADLAILCERFTTSKLSTFSDLTSIGTYGFRGEALASISHVAHLSILTKTKEDDCAWKACYADGSLVPAKSGLSAEPKPCAGNDGTLITVEDLFYNTLTRLSALRSSAEEYTRILDVISRYAAHNPTVSFVCKKSGSTSPDISTPSSSSIPTLVKLLYGPAIARELVHVPIKPLNPLQGQKSMWHAEAYITNANYHAKKMVFLLFINHRAVESSRIKRVLEAAYNGILPKGTSPFVYLSIEIDPSHVDVNVHPTKREVHFLNEEDITNDIMDRIQTLLASWDGSKTYEYQPVSTGSAVSNAKERDRGSKIRDTDSKHSPRNKESSSTGPKPLPQHHVRGPSHPNRTLDSMFPSPHPAQTASGSEEKIEPVPTIDSTRRVENIEESECYLSSIIGMRASLAKHKHIHLADIIQNHTFVGVVDLQRCVSLIQHSTKLYLVNHASLSEELFYQVGLRQFGNFNRIKLDPPPSMRDLVRLAVDCEEGIRENGLDPAAVSESIVDILLSRHEMLAEYFNLTFTEAGELQSLPMLLRHYTPDLNRLPLFLMRLGPQINWDSEVECFEGILRELAFFFAPGPTVHQSLNDTDTLPATNIPSEGSESALIKAERWQIEHVVFSAARRYLSAPKSLLDNDIVQVANLPDLYRVFERC